MHDLQVSMYDDDDDSQRYILKLKSLWGRVLSKNRSANSYVKMTRKI